MPSIEVKSFDQAEEVNEPNNARVEAVTVGGQRVLRLHLKPGWKWSQDVKPNVGTDSCEASHCGVIIAGTVRVRHDDGTEGEYSTGDAYAIKPGHDAWVVGDEEAIAFEFHDAWGE
jgi:hypothetical protein